MSSLITQLVSEEPIVLAIGSGEDLETELWSALKTSGATLNNISTHSLHKNSHSFDSDLKSAYKIVCSISATQVPADELVSILTALSSYQAKLIVIFHIDSGIQFSAYEPDVVTKWRVVSDLQEKNIRQLTKQLQNARIIFCQDTFYTNSSSRLPSWTTLVADQFELFDPKIPFFPLFPSTAVKILQKEILLPLPQPSMVLRGSELSSTELLKKVVSSLTNMSLRSMTIKSFTANPRQLLPFSVKEVTVAADDHWYKLLSDVLASRVPTLPQPKQVPSLVQPSKTPLSDKRENVLVPTTVASQTIITEKFIAPPVKRHSVITRETVDVSDELQKIFAASRVSDAVERVVTIAKTEKTTVKKGKRKRILFSGGVLAICVGLCMFMLVGIYAGSVLVLKNALEKALTATKTIDQVSSNDSLVAHTFPSSKLTQFVAIQQKLYGGIFETEFSAHAQQYVEIGQLLPKAVAEIQASQMATKALYSFVMGNELGDVDQLSKQAATAAQNGYELLSQLQAILKLVPFGKNTNEIEQEKIGDVQAEQSQPFEKTLIEVRKTLAIQQQLHVLLPAILGDPTKRTYAVVFQNSQEIRPTGGFIQSVALLTFANGSLINTEVVSSYELDQNLLGSVQPPAEVQKYLGEKHWFLRDSNWDPHFPSAAGKIAWFIDKTKGQQVDGVIAFNLISLQELLAAIGPIEVPEFNEVITNKNLMERMEFHSEVVLTPDTDQRDYSTILLEKIITKAMDLPQDSVLPTISAFEKSLAEKEILIALFADSEAALVESLGWSGGIVRPDCPSQLSRETCVVDYLYPVEANVGVNKANAYTVRSVLHEVELSQVNAMHTHTLRVENTARSNSWPKGTYKNYIRFLIPQQGEVRGVTINGKNVEPSQITQYVERGVNVVGIETAVPIQQQSEISLEYTVPFSAPTTFSYAMFIQKQPGIGEVPMIIRIAMPPNVTPIRIAPSAVITEDVIEFNLKQTEHVYVGVQFK